MQVYLLLAAMNPVKIFYLSLGILQGAGSKELPEIDEQKKWSIFWIWSKAFSKAWLSL